METNHDIEAQWAKAWTARREAQHMGAGGAREAALKAAEAKLLAIRKVWPTAR